MISVPVTYVLIAMGLSGTITFHDFNSKKACEAAAQAVVDTFKSGVRVPYHPVCTLKYIKDEDDAAR